MRPLTAARFSRPRTGITEQIQIQYDDLIDFRIGDPDLTTSPLISRQALNDAEQGYTHYMGSFGDGELLQELVKAFQEDYGLSYGTGNFMVTASGSHAMWLALQVTVNPGDEIIITDPCFDSYPLQVQDAGGIPVRLPLLKDQNWMIDPERLERLITPKTRGMILNTPNNPCAVSYPDELLKQIADIAERYDLLVYADDIYPLFSYLRPFTPIASLEGMRRRTITIRSFSKDFVMTGWRIGCIVAEPEVIQAAGAYNGHIVYSAPSVSQRAALQALRIRKEVQPLIREEFLKRAECAISRLSRIPYFDCGTLDSSIYLFPGIQKTGLTSQQFCEKMLQEAHVGFFPGNAFGNSGERFIRIALTCSEDEINEAFDRIERVAF